MTTSAVTNTTAAPDAGEPTYGGQVVGQALKAGGVEALFGIYGSIGLVIEEANRLGIPMYHFRHEQSAGFAADAYARALRKPGVCFSSSAPGFTNLVSPIAQAKSALSPVVLLNGQHGTTGDGIDTIQEGYATEVLKPFAKWTHRCLDWNMHSHWVGRALTESAHYPPGPVVLEFPRNSLNVRGPRKQLKSAGPGKVAEPALTYGDPREVERIVQLLCAAKRPLIVAGDGVYWSRGEEILRRVAEKMRIPVHTRRTARGAVPENHPLAFAGGYRGDLFREADVICIIGLRASYLEEWFEPPEWRRDITYIQIQERPEEVWSGLPTAAAAVGASANVLQQMLEIAERRSDDPDRSAWIDKLEQARRRFKQRQEQAVARWLAPDAPILHPHVLGAKIAEVLDDDATVIFDSFTATSFLTDKLQSKFAGQILDAGLHQPVGHGIGMAVGAQVARPRKQVLTLMGDGGFGISAMDMETLVRYQLPAVVVLLNNNSWSTVAAGHDSFYPDMGSWDNTHGIRYDRMMAELGCHVEHCERADQITPALDRAFESGKPALVHVVGDTTEVHPLRLRICWGDTWTRGNLDSLPPSAKEELRRAASPGTLRRVQKYWLDNGIEIPLEDLARMADFPIEKL
jgi:acetolactate synthase-1/2/3 large subunit